MTREVEGRTADPAAGVPSRRCPQCGSRSVARIVYGEPPADAELDAEIRAGRIVLGGCVVAEDQPEHRCLDCGKEFELMAPLTTTLLPRHPRPGRWHDGRLVLTGAAQSDKHPPDRRDLLAAAFDELMRQDVTIRYLVTPAGFFAPKAPPELDPTHGWDATPGDFEDLRRVAEGSVAKQLDSDTLTAPGARVVSRRRGRRPGARPASLRGDAFSHALRGLGRRIPILARGTVLHGELTTRRFVTTGSALDGGGGREVAA